MTHFCVIDAFVDVDHEYAILAVNAKRNSTFSGNG